jgi:NAD(P)-dependent dehydrogenase (short-subunit alcohol dehydrogenase family)
MSKYQRAFPSQITMRLIMTAIPYRTVLIVGAGSGISASVARGLAAAGLKVGLAARNIEKLAPLAAEIGGERFAVDASDPAAVAHLFEAVEARLGAPDVVLYNASARAHGPVAEIDPEAVRKAIEISAFGGFLVVQQAVRRMIPKGQGAILLTGASASVKGYPLSSAFAMGKFALRGLAQSTARELGPKGIHVAHFVIDGGVRSARRPDPADRPDSTLDPDGIAQTYLEVLRQPRSAWSLEVEMRPWVETF